MPPMESGSSVFPAFAFDQGASAVRMIELDYQAETAGSIKRPGISMAILRGVVSDFTRRSPLHDDMVTLYQNIVPNEAVINLLTRFSSDPVHFRFPPLDLFDTEKKADGILSANGLKRPMYYIMQLLENIPVDILSYGSDYIALIDGGNLTVILFNPNQKGSVTVDTIIRNAPPHCKLTKYHLRAANSCLTYWAQLNFQHQLADEDYDAINLMTSPDISFDVLPHDPQYYMSTELAPYDVMVLRFQG